MFLNLVGHTTSFYFEAVGKLQLQKMANKINLWGMLSIFCLVISVRLHVAWICIYCDLQMLSLLSANWWKWHHVAPLQFDSNCDALACTKVRDCELVGDVEIGICVAASAIVVVAVFTFLAFYYRSAFKELCQKIKDLPDAISTSTFKVDTEDRMQVWIKL